MMNPKKAGEAVLKDPATDAPLGGFRGFSEIDFARSTKGSESAESPLRRAWIRYSWLLWENRRLLYKATVRTVVVSTVVALLIPSRFQSTVNIMPPEQGDRGALLSLLAGRGEGNSDGGASGLASLAGSFLGMSSSGALFVELIQSRTVEDHIIDRFNLQKVYRARYKQDARNTLVTRTGVEQDRKSGVISITVTDTSPQRAREMAQAYVEELDHLLSQVSTSSARRERIFIEERLAAVKSDLEDAERRFSAFASKNNALDIKEQAKAEVEAAAVLQGQLIGAQSELQGMQQIYTGNNVRVRSLKARIDELRSQLQRISGTDASLTADNSDSSQDFYPSIRKLPLLGVEWADLYRKTKIQETVYQLLNQQYELTRIQEAKEIPTIRVIDPANLPEKKSWPPRLLIIMTITGGAFLCTVLWIAGSDSWERIDRRDPGKLLAMNIWNRCHQGLQNTAVRLHLDKVSWLPSRFRGHRET